MKVFVTGATGFVGRQVVAELAGNGHQVLGLARSADKARALKESVPGVAVLLGDMADPGLMAEGIAACDAVAHLAFDHDFSRFAENCAADRALILRMGAALAGQGKPLLVTSGVALAQGLPGQPATEEGPRGGAHHPRIATEEALWELADRGLNAMLMRLPQVHDTSRFGLITYLLQIWQRDGVCSWLGQGDQRWPAAHVADVGRAYRLALEQARPGAVFHAVAETGVTLRAIAETAARRLGLPARGLDPGEAGHFGWLAHFMTSDLPASADLTRQRLGWAPRGPGLLEDLAAMELLPEA